MGMLETIVNAFAPGGNQGVQARRTDIDAAKLDTARLNQQAERAQQQFHMDALDKYLKMARFPWGRVIRCISACTTPREPRVTGARTEFKDRCV